MSRQPIVLLVEDNAKHARVVARVAERLAMPYPVHVTSGEDGVLWVGANQCDLCLLDYDLPGIDGLETLIRIHQRQPNLPVVMVSGARSEGVAVAAFRAGVADYIPKDDNFEEAVTAAIHRFAPPITMAAPPQAGAPAVSERLARLTYENRLRVIGRQLDLYAYRAVNLFEVGGGFLVRALLPGSRVPDALEFPDRDFPPQLEAAIAARGEGERLRSTSALLPIGYEDFLRALGHRFDQRLAEAITVSELDKFITVGGVAKIDGLGDTLIEPFRELLRPTDVTDLVDSAFRRRAHKASTLGRLFGRQ